MEHLKDAQLGWEYYPIGAIKEIGELQGNFDFQSLLGQVKPEELTSYLLKSINSFLFIIMPIRRCFLCFWKKKCLCCFIAVQEKIEQGWLLI